MTRSLYSIAALGQHVGERLGASEWFEITQERIDRFAAAVDDFHPVHTDPEYATAFGLAGTIAHGPYLVSIGPKFLYELVDVTDGGGVLLSGYNRVRFITPVLVGSRVRMAVSVEAAEAIPGGTRFTLKWTFEVEDQERPAGVAEVLLAYFPAS